MDPNIIYLGTSLSSTLNEFKGLPFIYIYIVSEFENSNYLHWTKLSISTLFNLGLFDPLNRGFNDSFLKTN